MSKINILLFYILSAVSIGKIVGYPAIEGILTTRISLAGIDQRTIIGAIDFQKGNIR